jgi:hypothetical protein
LALLKERTPNCDFARVTNSPLATKLPKHVAFKLRQIPGDTKTLLKTYLKVFLLDFSEARSPVCKCTICLTESLLEPNGRVFEALGGALLVL